MSSQFHGIFGDYSELSLRCGIDQEAICCYFNPLCFSPQQPKDCKAVQKSITDYFQTGIFEPNYPIRYVVPALQTTEGCPIGPSVYRN
ncbi:MAG: hypothetical protein PVI54_04130 [Desulfobacteraceae bacterium]|jgi:hypothetical protein